MKRKDNIKTGLQLFGFFFKIGCFTFGGGWSILAQMEQEFVDKRKWITKEELLDLVAVGKSVPGIMITNISMLFGYSVGGLFGGICSVIGIACPAVLILSLVVWGYEAVKENALCYSVLHGIRSAVVPIMGSVVLSLGKDALKNKTAAAICIGGCILCLFTDISNIALICLGIAGALIASGIRAVRTEGRNYDIS